MKIFGSYQQRLICVCLLLTVSFVSSSSVNSLWIKDSSFDNKLSASGYDVTARSKLHCSRTCSTESTCISFFFAPGQDLNCQLHDSIMTSSAGLQDVSVSMYYKLDGAPQLTTNTEPAPVTTAVASSAAPPFTCPPDDIQFRTVQLDDGNTFTYKVVKMSVIQSLAALSCGGEGGFLTRVTSVAKMNMLVQLLTDCPGYNGNDYYVDGSNAAAPNPESADAWIMSNGDQVPMTADFWGATYPNHPDWQHCFRMREDIDYKWDDCDCNNPYYFICEQ